ncbi:MAG: restriction endonuclease subunit S [Ardenticatenales bacterium]|nr:restriction endonuclease subunit S [Ardenticatenales bacterium]
MWHSSTSKSTSCFMLIVFLFSPNGKHTVMNQGTSIAGITRETLATLPILLPPLAEQRAIAEILSDMDAELDALEARREKTRQLKQGMMQQLLTGKVRLVTPEETP